MKGEMMANRGRGTRWALLMMGTALCGAMAAPAWAESPQAPQQVAQAAPTQRFDIPAQPLASALTSFARQTGLRLAYGSDLANGLSSPGVRGVWTNQDALARLLSGTGLTWRFTDAQTVTLEKVAANGAMTLDPVTVQGQGVNASGTVNTILESTQGYTATRVLSASKTNTSILETPQSISVVTKDQLDDQNVQSLNHTKAR